MNGMGGVFGVVSSIGTRTAGAMEKYSADMQPKPITETKVPTVLPTQPSPILGQSAQVIGESIFGQYIYASDSIPQAINPSWEGKLAAVQGFGDPIDQQIPVGLQWGGHGIFGGPLRRGPYGMNRYGEPVEGLGEMSTTTYVVGAGLALAAIGAGLWFMSRKKA
jgi:hypothetical protein